MMFIIDNNGNFMLKEIDDFKTEIKNILEQSTKKIKIRKNLKFIIAGEGAVGKTTMIQRYLGRPYRAHYLVTLGVQTSSTSIDLEPLIGIQGTIDLQLWDLAGQQQFREVLKYYYMGTDEAIVVGDLSRLNTFETIIDWLKEINKQNMKKTPFIVAGSKHDLVKGLETSLESKIKERLLKIKTQSESPFNEDLIFIKTSSLDNYNITDVFEIAILRNILRYNR